MNFIFRLMEQKEAEEIANNWKYKGIYSFYDSINDYDDYEILTDPKKRTDPHFSCYSDNELVGFYCIEIKDDKRVDLGLGLKSEFTGRGFGEKFINAILDQILLSREINEFILNVAEFNKRAIKAYKKAGFIEIEKY